MEGKRGEERGGGAKESGEAGRQPRLKRLSRPKSDGAKAARARARVQGEGRLFGGGREGRATERTRGSPTGQRGGQERRKECDETGV